MTRTVRIDTSGTTGTSGATGTTVTMTTPSYTKQSSGLSASSNHSTSTSTSSSSYNKVRVVSRIRPLSKQEEENGCKVLVDTVGEDSKVLQILSTSGISASNTERNSFFELDAVLDSNSSQESVYFRSGAKNAVAEDLFQGLNCTILAYGQTGAGKTFTMGTAAGTNGNNVSDGVIPRACHDLFQSIQSKCDGNAKVTLSYLEIYNEEIRDLLIRESSSSSPQPLKIRETLNGEVYVGGLQARAVESPQQIGEYMEEASQRRVVASTKMNSVSSRSHAICVLRIQGILEDSTKFQSKLTLVDLAGSERIKKTGSNDNKRSGNKGNLRRQEGININKGLFVLGQVVSALAEQRQKFQRKPPYRDSKLTRLLQDSLGGNSRTIMIACVSPADANVGETTNTLRYARNARNIRNKATRNIVKSISPQEAAKLDRENQLLKAQVKQLEETINIMTMEALELQSVASMSTEMDFDDNLSNRISTLTSIPDEVYSDGGNLDILQEEKAKYEKKIAKLEKQVEHLTTELEKSKINVRKSAHASAIELPALRIQLEALEQELVDAEDVKKENESLWEQVEMYKADVASAQAAAKEWTKQLHQVQTEKALQNQALSQQLYDLEAEKEKEQEVLFQELQQLRDERLQQDNFQKEVLSRQSQAQKGEIALSKQVEEIQAAKQAQFDEMAKEIDRLKAEKVEREKDLVLQLQQLREEKSKQEDGFSVLLEKVKSDKTEQYQKMSIQLQDLKLEKMASENRLSEQILELQSQIKSDKEREELLKHFEQLVSSKLEQFQLEQQKKQSQQQQPILNASNREERNEILSKQLQDLKTLRAQERVEMTKQITVLKEQKSKEKEKMFQQFQQLKAEKEVEQQEALTKQYRELQASMARTAEKDDDRHHQSDGIVLVKATSVEAENVSGKSAAASEPDINEKEDQYLVNIGGWLMTIAAVTSFNLALTAIGACRTSSSKASLF